MKTIIQISILMVSLIASTIVIAECTLTRNNDITITKPDSRYVDNGNGTVTDKVTGLMWKKCIEGLSGADCTTGTAKDFDWYTSSQNTKNDVTAGYSDWRVPNKNELFSLIENACQAPAINQTVFPNTMVSSYWTSSPSIQNADSAWNTSFTGHGNTYRVTKTNKLRVRLVRDVL